MCKVLSIQIDWNHLWARLQSSALLKKKVGIFEVGYVEAMGCMNKSLCVVVCIGLVLISLPHFVLGWLTQLMVKSKITFFQFMFVHSVLLACLVLRNVKRKVTCRKLFASKHRSSLPCGNREKLFIVGIAKLTQG